MQDDPLPSVGKSALRGIACKCPRCGSGKLYRGFLALRPACEACGLDYTFIDAGDGPAVFIILIAGFIVVGCALIVEIKYQPPYWVHAVLWLPLVLATTLLPLRSMKALLIALQFHHKDRGRPVDRSSLMSAVATNRRGVIGLGIFTLLILTLLIGLGGWQLQRRTEKHALIAALSERLAAAPADLPATAQWSALTAAHDEFRRVRFLATYESLPDAMVYSSGSAIRDDISGPGTWAFVPALLPEGDTVVINTGFVQNTMQDRAVEDRAVTRLITGAPEILTGYIRFPESAGALTPSENPAKRLWFTRDISSMARMLGWTKDARQIAPFYIDLESPVPPSGVPKPGPLSINLRDDHLQYAITWFGLAVAVMIAFIFWLRGRRRT